MQPKIQLTKIWSDDYAIELKTEVSDGRSLFVKNVYIGNTVLSDLIRNLETFVASIHGGVFDMKLGEFGHEYANGAFLARLKFETPTKITISTSQIL